ncbi:MAG: serine/threonine-protein kinase [Gemmatimonadota bacterium]
MSADAPSPGQVLGAYTLDRLLGQGGFAWVYEARREDGKSFAVKVLKPRYATDPAFESRFRQESVVAAGLAHPNIVHIEEIGSDRGFVFFAMDLYPETLATRLAASGHLEEKSLVAISLGVSRALAFAHGRNVIHRDIKPDNVLLGAHDLAVLTDFGIARAVSGYVAATGFMMTIGTPHYISPEQAQGRPIDGRTDIYSLGITMYRAATGDLPFRSRDWYELARLHVEAPPEPPRMRRPELSKRIERIILRCLAKHPDDRYKTAEELTADLQDIDTRIRPTSEIPLPSGYLPEPERPEAKTDRKWWKPW